MKSGPTYNVQFRRKRTKKTDYKKRLAMLKSGDKRFVVRLSNHMVIAQVVEYQITGDKSIVAVTSKNLKSLGWNFDLKNTPAIYLTALLLAEKAKEKGVKKVIFDVGLRNYKSKTKIFAALKAISDAGLECPFDEKVLPLQDRIEGKHISDDVNKNFELVKNKILKK